MDLVFYDVKGIPTCYTDDYKYIYLFSGQPVAHFVDGSIYSFKGKHLGRFENGWIRDDKGEAVFYTEFATGGPFRPSMRLQPTKGIKKTLPMIMTTEWPPFHPVTKTSWAKASGPQFFATVDRFQPKPYLRRN